MGGADVQGTGKPPVKKGLGGVGEGDTLRSHPAGHPSKSRVRGQTAWRIRKLINKPKPEKEGKKEETRNVGGGKKTLDELPGGWKSGG